MNRLALSLLLYLSLTVAHAATPPPQWLPQDSWPGGKHYDARLDKTVTFWGTGLPAAEVFADIAKETGVPLGFFPPDDDNARICLNLYLNPQHPPTLRDLLVQLGWTLDCAWAVEGKGDQSRYLLLHTTLGDNAFEKIIEESDAAARRRGEEENEARSKQYTAAMAKLPELREALRLSRDAAIKRYQGTDNALLLTLLDPARRAVAQLVLSLPDDDLSQLEPFSGISREWDELTPEQQAWVVAAMEPVRARLAEEVQKGWRNGVEQWDPFSGEWDLRVGFTGSAGGFSVDLFGRSKALLANGRRRAGSLDAVSVTLSRDPSAEELYLWDDIALRRLLGEKISDEQVWSMEQENDNRRQLQQQRALVAQQLDSLCRLSPEVAARLRTLRLPVETEQQYALWQLQEAVAMRSGMNVISDHFAQPSRDLAFVLGLLPSASPSEPDALSLLQASCVATSERENLRSGGADQFWTVARWEWGDAGDFLRFRSADRDAWRAAFLPAAAVATLDGWLAPHLPTDVTAETEATVPLDVRQTGALLTQLDAIQRLWGGALTYGRALDEAERWRRSFRLAFTQVTWRQASSFYVMLSGLDDAQWQQAQAEGLLIGTDFTLRPDSAEDTWGRSGRRDLLAYWQGQLLRLVPGQLSPPPPGSGSGGGMAAFGGASSRWMDVVIRRDGAPPDQRYEERLATEVAIHPDRLPHLIPPL